MAELEEGAPGGGLGLTLYDTDKYPCLKRTGVYWPKYDSQKNYSSLNVVIWLHGLFVTGHKALLTSDPAAIRSTMSSSGRDVVLIAPFIGNTDAYYGQANGLGEGNFGERYINQVLDALAQYHQRCGGLESRPVFGVGNLVLAGHSAGGWSMRQLVGSLGNHKAKLRECWGFDCLYAGGNKPRKDDDATFWHTWSVSQDGRPLHIFAGASTIHQSVKLALMAKGLATATGDRADPRKSVIDAIHVALAGSTSGNAPALGTFVDGLGNASAGASNAGPAPTRSPASVEELKATYAYKKAEELKKLHPMDASMEFHYQIAKAYFLLRLKSVSF